MSVSQSGPSGFSHSAGPAATGRLRAQGLRHAHAEQGCTSRARPAGIGGRCRCDGRRAQGRSRGHRRLSEDAAGLAGRLSHDRCGGRRHLCRQGPLAQGARVQLRAHGRPHQPHRPHDLGDGRHGVRDDAHGIGSAAPRSQSHQALPPALQRAAARRQIVPLHSADGRSRGAADRQASRRAQSQRHLLRSVRVGRRRQSRHQHAAARVPAAGRARIPSTRPARGPACCIRSSAAPDPARARSRSRITRSSSRRRARSCAARARRCAGGCRG